MQLSDRPIVAESFLLQCQFARNRVTFSSNLGPHAPQMCVSNLNNLGGEAHDTLQHAATHLYLPFVMFIPKAISKRRRHQLGANVATFYVIKITTPRTPRVTRIENILRESVQSTVGRLKLHLFRYFKKINLLLFNSEHTVYCVLCTLQSRKL